LRDHEKAPPVRQSLKSACEVALACDESGSVEYLAEQVNLVVKTSKAILVRLNFVAVQRTVHQRHVNAAPAPADAEFLDNDRAGLGVGLDRKPLTKYRSYLGVADDIRSRVA